MSYSPNIPAATDDPSVSQSAIQQNFGTINTAFALNHVALGSGGSAGKHNFVEMPVQGATPTTIAGEGTLYTKSVTSDSQTRSQLIYTSDNDTSGGPPIPEVYQMTRVIHARYSLFSTNTNYQLAAPGFPTVNGGWTFLPGGMLMQYGLAGTNVTPIGTTGSVIFPVAFTTGCFSLTIIPIRNSSNVDIVYASSTAGLTSFSYRNTAGGINQFYWTAIGV